MEYQDDDFREIRVCIGGYPRETAPFVSRARAAMHKHGLRTKLTQKAVGPRKAKFITGTPQHGCTGSHILIKADLEKALKPVEENSLILVIPAWEPTGMQKEAEA